MDAARIAAIRARCDATLPERGNRTISWLGEMRLAFEAGSESGQEAMRERAAKKADQFPDAPSVGAEIRALPIE
jgi:hypothetical protein